MAGGTSSGYWYADENQPQLGVDVLAAMRDYRTAEAAMRKRSREAMRMGETDMAAIRLLLQAHGSGRTMGPKELATKLGISSASTTILVDRLEARGHVERMPHPSDGRSIIIRPTPSSDSEVRAAFGSVHERMLQIAASLEPEQARTIVEFLRAMRHVVGTTGQPQPTPPAEGANPPGADEIDAHR